MSIQSLELINHNMDIKTARIILKTLSVSKSDEEMRKIMDIASGIADTVIYCAQDIYSKEGNYGLAKWSQK